MTNIDYVSFEQTHVDTDDNGNIVYYIDGFPADENAEGTVIATIALTPHNDTVINWHHNGYRLNQSVLELINTVKTDINKIIAERTYIENKPLFIKNMLTLLNQTREFADIENLEYKEENAAEWLYVYYKSHSTKRINISCDSCSAILRDFLRKIDDAEWVLETMLDNFDECSRKET